MMRRLLTCAVLALLSACVAIPPASEPHDAQARQTRLSHIDGFRLEGRIAASGEVAGKANLVWQQHQNQFDLRLSGPFGVGGLSLSGTQQRVAVRSKDQNFITADPEAYLHAQLGWTLPLDHLRWWALGLPAPETPAPRTLDQQGRVAQLEQDGWTIRYEQFQTVDTLELPRKLTLQRDAVTLRLVIDAWSKLEFQH